MNMLLPRPVRLALLAAILVVLPVVVRNPYYIHLLIMTGVNAVPLGHDLYPSF